MPSATVARGGAAPGYAPAGMRDTSGAAAQRRVAAPEGRGG